MSKQPARARRAGPPPPHVTGQSLYGEAFDSTTTGGLGESIGDWVKLSEAERSFTIAHLLYLTLQSQGRSFQVQVRGVRLLSELSSDLADVMEMLTEPEDGDDDEGQDDDEAEGNSGGEGSR